MKIRIGQGFDIHATGPGDHILLGGVQIGAPFSLIGHSDADVLLHAITDALLGAIADNDIGHHFPGSPENKDRPSEDFARFALEKVKSSGYSIANIDSTVICEQPKIGPEREKIRQSVANIFEIGIDQVSVKGKTSERLGAVGRGEGIACQVSVLLTS